MFVCLFVCVFVYLFIFVFLVGAGCGPVDEGELCGDAQGAGYTRQQGRQPPREFVPLQLHHRWQRSRGGWMGAVGTLGTVGTVGTGFGLMSKHPASTWRRFMLPVVGVGVWGLSVQVFAVCRYIRPACAVGTPAWSVVRASGACRYRCLPYVGTWRRYTRPVRAFCTSAVSC